MLIIFILPGIILWIVAMKWFPDDMLAIKKILEERAETLKTQQIQGDLLI